MRFDVIRTVAEVFLTASAILILSSQSSGQYPASAKQEIGRSASGWIPDNGDGTYTNPIIYADYSDPDVIRVGDHYYLTSSSFSHFPGLPILYSKDLVNWRIISHAVTRYTVEAFTVSQHGGGIWAPSIRYHNEEFYIYFGDPDRGILMTKARHAAGPWQPLILVREAKGWIDPCPLWDDDGNAYLVHAWAKSRSGISSILTLNKMNSEGTKILDDGVTIFDGRANHPTIEGPKMYERNGYYYIFAPAGGVKRGWQTVLRSKNIYGPYEDKIVLEQGSTSINGPHQGAWVETQTGESWFIHFQDRDAYGRIVHLQPMRWVDDWPVMGTDLDGNGVGEPVSRHRKPNVGRTYPIEVPQTDDDFSSRMLGLQWQWESNCQPGWFSLQARKGWLRLYSQPSRDSVRNLWDAGNILAQKFPGPEFCVTTKIEFKPRSVGGKAGLIIYGLDYSYIAVEQMGCGFRLVQACCTDADKGTSEMETASLEVSVPLLYLRVQTKPEAVCSFSYSTDGKEYLPFGGEFVARAGKWVGAKVGVFTVSGSNAKTGGFADFDWFRYECEEK